MASVQVSFLYRGDEPGSALLRDALGQFLLAHGGRLWSDARASDPGFAAELVEELGRSDAIVHSVGPKGPGFYQKLNEIDKTIDAMRVRPDRRLVIVLLGGAVKPTEFKQFDDFAQRTETIHLEAELPDAMAVLRAAVPGAIAVPDSEVAKLASEVVLKTRYSTPKHSLTIVVGPYAFAEATEPTATPARMIRSFLRKRALHGFVPWLDVVGSIARATASDDDTGAQAIAEVLSPESGLGGGALGVYLRLLAANWERYGDGTRLFIVVCGPDLRVDTALQSSAMPVGHVRLVHCPREPARLVAERVSIIGGRGQRQKWNNAEDEQLGENDRVVLIKPLGCIEQPEKAVLTAEQWRQSSVAQMPLPLNLAPEMTRSFLLVLGAGAFSPSLQIVFSALLHDALKRVANNSNRYMIHNPSVRVADPLHRVEALLARAPADDEKRQAFEDWLRDTYGLKLRLLPSVPLLGWIDNRLNVHQPVPA
jgi:hypothetical protein